MQAKKADKDAAKAALSASGEEGAASVAAEVGPGPDVHFSSARLEPICPPESKTTGSLILCSSGRLKSVLEP